MSRVPQMPERHREDLPEDLEWMQKTTASGVPYIAINSALSDKEAREAEREATKAYNRDQRRRGILALPLLGTDTAKRGAQEHPAAAVAAVAVVVAAGLVAAAVLLPHSHAPSDRPLAQAHPSTPANPPAHSRPSQPPVASPPDRSGVPPSTRPGHSTKPVADRPVASHPVHPKPPPTGAGRPPAEPPASPPTAASPPCGIYLNVLGMIRLKVRIGARLLGVQLCPRSP